MWTRERCGMMTLYDFKFCDKTEKSEIFTTKINWYNYGTCPQDFSFLKGL